jgi:hypothetical protein
MRRDIISIVHPAKGIGNNMTLIQSGAFSAGNLGLIEIISDRFINCINPVFLTRCLKHEL